MLTKRSKEKELLDLGSAFYSPAEYAQCLKLLFKINQILGVFRNTVALLKHFPSNATVVDIGCGGGLFLLHLNQHYPDMHMLGLDISNEAITIAAHELYCWKQNNEHININFQLQESTQLTLAENSVDIILMTLVCHHIEDDALIVFFKDAYKATRKAIIINELHRNMIAYWFYKLLSPFMFRNRLITHDGLISIKRGFTRRELTHLLKRANIKHYKIKWRFPFQWSVV